MDCPGELSRRMKEARILVLDFGATTEIRQEWDSVVHSASFADARVLHKRVSLQPTDGVARELERISRQFSPGVFVLLLGGDESRDAVAIARLTRQAAGPTPVVVVRDHHDPDETVELLKEGVADFLTPPLQADDVLPRIWRLIQRPDGDVPLTQTLLEKIGLKRVIGKNPAFVSELEKIPLVARCDIGVLILGETGTGKELCARAIHYLSGRAKRPFVPVNCGAVPVELMENELFGHDKGAFTGAAGSRDGLIQEAEGGTLFLDEVDCLPALAQVKLLRFLQEREYRPLGSCKTRRGDVRVIAASNSELADVLKNGRLRKDLFFRLNVVPILLPPLRERQEDIPLLARHFLAKCAADLRPVASSFSAEAMEKLVHHDWPGNVRELEHLIQRVAVLARHPLIDGADIPLEAPARPASIPETFREAKARTVTQFEVDYLQSVLAACRGNITQAARAAGKNRRAFWQLVRKHRIDVTRWRTAEARGQDNLAAGAG